MRQVSVVFDHILEILAYLAGFLLIFIVFSISADITMRYFLNRSITWSVEISEYSLLFILFLGAAWVLKKEGHIKIDILFNMLTPKTKLLLNIITSSFCTIISIMLFWYGARATFENFQMGYQMTTILSPPKFLILAIIPVGSLLLVIQFIRRTYGYYQNIKVASREEAVDHMK